MFDHSCLAPVGDEECRRVVVIEYQHWGWINADTGHSLHAYRSAAVPMRHDSVD
jgi:hypothetical protein